MFNETSYPSSGLGDAAAVQRRIDAGKRVKQSKLDKFGLTAPVQTMPARRVVPAGSQGGGVMVDPLVPAVSAPAIDSGSASDSGGSGFDLGGIFSALPWWVWAIGAYMLLKKR